MYQYFRWGTCNAKKKKPKSGWMAPTGAQPQRFFRREQGRTAIPWTASVRQEPPSGSFNLDFSGGQNPRLGPSLFPSSNPPTLSLGVSRPRLRVPFITRTSSDFTTTRSIKQVLAIGIVASSSGKSSRLAWHARPSALGMEDLHLPLTPPPRNLAPC